MTWISTSKIKKEKNRYGGIPRTVSFFEVSQMSITNADIMTTDYKNGIFDLHVRLFSTSSYPGQVKKKLK